MFGKRPDASPVRDLNAMRRFMPYVSPRRNDSVFYMRQDIRADAALEFIFGSTGSQSIRKGRPPLATRRRVDDVQRQAKAHRRCSHDHHQAPLLSGERIPR